MKYIYQNIKVLISKQYTLLIIMSSINLVYMHYCIISSNMLELPLDSTSFFDILLGVVFDTSIIYLFACLLSWGNTKSATAITFFITSIWAIINIIYSHFFNNYITLSAIKQSTSILDPLVIKSTINSIEYKNLFFIVFSFIFFLLYRRIIIPPLKKTISSICLTLLFIILCDMASHALFCLSEPSFRYLSYYLFRLNSRHVAEHNALCEPLFTTLHRGNIRMLISESIDEIQGPKELTNDQKEIIYDLIKRSKDSVIITSKLNVNNIVFIIVESYMSFTSGMKINNKEITPFLNSLSRDSTVYYNGHVTPNITLGESSDGQFIYMTGLLPTRSSITISRVRNKVLPGLPKIISAMNKRSRMIIPTQPTLWNQSVMCQQYGFDHLFSSEDYDNSHRQELNDQEVFELASKIDCKYKHQSFFSVILTVSMHQPYTDAKDYSFKIKDETISNELKNYLNACHYTDKCICEYINHLKMNNLYDNSLIIITADHHVHSTNFGIDITNELPLYIINGNIDNHIAWHGKCNQLDIYTTLLDLLNIETKWYGLGHSLLSPHYENSLNNMKWDISDQIIQSDFFKNY